MSPDKSQLETVTLNETSTAPLNETTLPQQSNLIGQVLDDRYRIEKELGQGGVGIVYLARDRKLHDKPVVIKILLDRSLQNSWVVQKFQQEKEALARVDHPGVVGILDTGELADGKPYLVMQFIDGVTLRSQIKPEGMSLDRSAEIIKQIGRALGAAHDRGIFHRDLKPENIMLQSFAAGEEQVKIIDFGIAKLKDSIVAPSTMTGATAGTVAYMAPEQLGGRPVSAATDIFAMGVIAYEMATGRKPFNPETGFELLEMQRAGVRVHPLDLRPALSAEANLIITRALSFAPEQRFQTAREFGDALARALTNQTSTSVQSETPVAHVPATQLATDANASARQTADLSPKTIAGRYEPAKVDALSQPSFVPLAEHDERGSGLGLKIAIAVVALVLIGAATSVAIWKRDAIFGGGASRSLNYSLTVQKWRDGKPYQEEFESSGQEIFENGWTFRMNISSPQDGYLYLINEGLASGDTTTYNVLFPESKTNGGSPKVSADQKLQTASMRFDDHMGTEKFWMVWSASPVKELQAVADVAKDQDVGEIRDAAKAKSVRDFLNSHLSPKPDVTKDSTKKQTVVSGKGNILVNLIELEHH
jgi:tRNA A-37 threonylcarbamoyl transferase component Bud32